MESTANVIELMPIGGNEQKQTPPLGLGLGFLGQLKVTVEVVVGRAEIEAERLLNMRQGEAVVLDKEVDAPVDLLVNGVVVARGTLVAVGEHLGVRLTDMPTLQGLPNT